MYDLGCHVGPDFKTVLGVLDAKNQEWSINHPTGLQNSISKKGVLIHQPSVADLLNFASSSGWSSLLDSHFRGLPRATQDIIVVVSRRINFKSWALVYILFLTIQSSKCVSAIAQILIFEFCAVPSVGRSAVESKMVKTRLSRTLSAGRSRRAVQFERGQGPSSPFKQLCFVNVLGGYGLKRETLN